MSGRLIAQAKKNFRDYRIMEKFTAGIVLTGSEIKSLRNHQVSINEAYIVPQKGEAYIINMHIATYKHSHAWDLTKGHDTRKKRKLLLQKKEINKLIGTSKAKNYAVIPLQFFINERGWAKLEIALAQSLRKYQIKAKIKEKEIQRKLREKDFS